MHKIFKKPATNRVAKWALALACLSFVFCENDITSIGSNLIDADNFSADLYDEATIVTYTKLLDGPVQTNGLSMYRLGYYNEPTFGPTTYSAVSELGLGFSNPTFDNSAVMDSVVLTIPYFSRPIDFNAETGETIYQLDSVYGSQPVEFRIYENNFFLTSVNPDDPLVPRRYYSDLKATIDANRGALLYEDLNFKPNDKEIVLTTTPEPDSTVVTNRLSPRLRIKLDNDFFKQKIFDQQGTPNLFNNNNFRNFFRGLYFEMTPINGQGTLFAVDLTNADINLFYTVQIVDGGDVEFRQRQFQLLLNGNQVNMYETQLNPIIQTQIDNSDSINGDANLFLKGGDGTVAFIELFGEDADDNGVADELEELREKAWLINEANLIFKVDQSIIPGGSTEPERIFLFDAENNTVLADFNFSNFNPNNPVNSRTDHLGRLVRNSNVEGVEYKIRITQHIDGLINLGADNVRLGLLLTQNVNELPQRDVRGSDDPPTVHTGSVLSHEGTVLFGNNAPDDVKLKLQIFFTEPD
ncbi:MAG: DUF4270 domain-containing protein [Flavobacteriaceae bacterium]|nr:DUF4270 domain-containing protein [Flavobacteriaceae bacterium]